MTISDKLKYVYSHAPVTDTYVECLQLNHSGFDNGAVYITNQLAGWEANLESGSKVFFEFLPFSVISPKSAHEGNFTLQVAIDNASRALMEQLETLAQKPTESIEVLYRVYLASDPTTVQNSPPLKLTVDSISANENILAFNAGLARLRKLPFPAMLYDTALYPGLAR
ncbi:MAG: DUF1833 family protein [Acidimicrobiia bacterium]|nr:DUF1833 family protein [Acidimicrobiia bacterium]